MPKIHEIIKARRVALGLSQKQLAIKARLSPSHICLIEQGAYSVQISTLEKIAKALDCEILLSSVRRGNPSTHP